MRSTLNDDRNRRRLQSCLHCSVPTAGLVSILCGTLLVISVLTVGVLSMGAVFIPIAVLGGVAVLRLFERHDSGRHAAAPDANALVQPAGKPDGVRAGYKAISFAVGFRLVLLYARSRVRAPVSALEDRTQDVRGAM